MLADDYVQVSVTNSELEDFPDPEQPISPTIKLQFLGILSHTLH